MVRSPGWAPPSSATARTAAENASGHPAPPASASDAASSPVAYSGPEVPPISRRAWSDSRRSWAAADPRPGADSQASAPRTSAKPRSPSPTSWSSRVSSS